MKGKVMLGLAVMFALTGSGTAAGAAERITVPIETLKPAVHLDKPTLKPAGGPLILSDSPETYEEDGAFYRDQVKGEFRVFWHHQYSGTGYSHVGVAVTNESDEAVELYVKGAGNAVNIYPDVAGEKAMISFMNTEKQRKHLKTLSPGESYVSDIEVPATYTNSGIAQYQAYTKRGKRPAKVTITTFSYKQNRPAHPETLPILAKDSHERGTFPHFDRIGTISYPLSLGNAYIAISSSPSGQWSDSLPGEYEEGIDATTGQKVMNNGNYGVFYRLQLAMMNDLKQPRLVSIYDNPAGGYGHFVIKWKNQLLRSGFLSYKDAWLLDRFSVFPGGRTIKTELSLPGGASGPSVLYFTNEPKK